MPLDQKAPYFVASNDGASPGDALLNSKVLSSGFWQTQPRHHIKRLFTFFSLLNVVQLVQALVIHDRILGELPEPPPPSHSIDYAPSTRSIMYYFAEISGTVAFVNLSENDSSYLAEVAGKRAAEQTYLLPVAVKTQLLLSHMRRKSIAKEESDIYIEQAAARAYFYFAMSCLYGSVYVPATHHSPLILHELRNRFHTLASGESRGKQDVYFTNEIDDAKNSFFNEQIFNAMLPALGKHVLSQSKSGYDVLNKALEIRESPEALSFRKLLTEIDVASKNGDLTSLPKALDELQDQGRRWVKGFEGPHIVLTLAFPNSKEFDPLGIGEHFQLKRKRHLIVLDDLYKYPFRSTRLDL